MGKPSVIVHAPQGAGKTFHAERLRRIFGCDTVCDDADGTNIYRKLMQEPSAFKARSCLYLTSEEPPEGCDMRRVVTLNEALQLAEMADAADARVAG